MICFLFKITVVDTPGLGMDSVEELASTKTIVQKLKEVEYVHTFAMLYNSVGDKRPTRERLAVFDHYNRIFGKHFLKNVIIVATHWGYDEASVYKRNQTMKGKDWLQHQKDLSDLNELEYADELRAVYFEPWDLTSPPSLAYHSYDNLKKLYDFSLENEPFHCQDIEVVLDAIAKKEEEIKNLTRQVSHLDECQKSRNQIPELEAKLETCTLANGAKIEKSQSKMIGLGIGCTVLGIIIGFITFRFYKLNTNNANFNDDEDLEDLERLRGNNEATSLENNQTEEAKTEQ